MTCWAKTVRQETVVARIALFLILAGVFPLMAQETPSPTPSPVAPQQSARPEPAASRLAPPQAEGSPSPAPAAQPSPGPLSAPQLLPETNQLPAPPPPAAAAPKGPPSAAPLPYDLIPGGAPAPTPPPKPSITQQALDRIRFRQLRSIAENDAYAMRLRWEAAQASTFEGRREYLRAYYRYTAALMRKIEPRLKATIDGYENGNIAGLKQVNIKPTIPLRDLERQRSQPQGTAASRQGS